MPYDAIFFDMGFTLVDLTPSAEAILARAIRDVTGRDVPYDALSEAQRAVWTAVLGDEPMVWEHPSEEADRRWILDIDRRVLTQVGITDQVDAISAHAYDLFGHPDSYRVYNDVWPTLAALRDRGYRLGIISNWGWHLPRVCEGLGLTPYFAGIFASARVGFEKPHPAFFHRVLAALGVHPARAIHVGDSVRADVHGAHAAGLDAILLVRDGRPVPADAGCPVIHTLLDLPALLDCRA